MTEKLTLWEGVCKTPANITKKVELGKRKYTTGKEHSFTFKIDASTRNKLAAVALVNKRSEEEEVYQTLHQRFIIRARLIASRPEIWNVQTSVPHSDEIYGSILTIIDNAQRIEKENNQLRAEIARMQSN